jgi:hypothetical protein
VRRTVVLLVPYPNNQNPVESFNNTTDFGLQGDCLVWYARPQLFFHCTTGAKGLGYHASHKEVSLVYFSTFEPIDLTPDSIMQQAGVPLLYDSASNPSLPCLYICPFSNVLGRAPLIQCFIGGNSHPTIPHSFKDDWRLGSASADTQRDRGNCSRLYEVNNWMWRYCWGRSRMVSIAEAERIRRKRISQSRIRAAENRKRHSEAASAAGAATVTLAICLGMSAILRGSSFPETAAIQYYSVLKHFKIKLYNII